MNEDRASRSDTTRLRAAIDSGRTGDKVAWLDFAAAPLGTDDEAGGAVPASHEDPVRASPNDLDKRSPTDRPLRFRHGFLVLALIFFVIIASVALIATV